MSRQGSTNQDVSFELLRLFRLTPYLSLLLLLLSLQPLEIDPHVFDFEELDFQDYQLALSGDVFRWMVDYAPLETLRRMLIKGTIFARMSPDEKHELIERLQALGYSEYKKSLQLTKMLEHR